MSETTSRRPRSPVHDVGPLAGSGLSCHYCGAPAVLHDHVVPRRFGGSNKPDNLVPSCWACNSSKSGHILGPNWKSLVAEAVDTGTSWSLLADCTPERLRMLLAAAARALVAAERARRLTADLGLGDVDLPHTRQMRP
jgi:hypothetical protein